MSDNHKLQPQHLARRAVVYLRQSSPGQVQHKQDKQSHSHEKSLRLIREKCRTSSPVTMKITRSATFET
jgi:hypothetical protein